MARPVVGRLGFLPFGLEFRNAVLKNVINVDDAFLNAAIEPFEAIFYIADLRLQ